MKKTLFSPFVRLATCSAVSQQVIKKPVNGICTLLGDITKTDFTADAKNQINYLKYTI